MVERAAKAVAIVDGYSGHWSGAPTAWEKLTDGQKAEMLVVSRAALLAALDPEDEALVEYVAQGMLTFAYGGATLATATPSTREYFVERSRAAIASIRALAQGES